MLAVLECAVHDVTWYRGAKSGWGQDLYRSARRWLFAHDPDWPLSFERICEEFDLSAEAMRRRLAHVADPSRAA